MDIYKVKYKSSALNGADETSCLRKIGLHLFR